MLTVTPIYAGLLLVLFFWLSLRVSLVRLKGAAGKSIEKDVMHQFVRTQGNAAEYIPLGLIALLILEFQGAPVILLHVFGLLLLGGRIGHFIAFSRSAGATKLRRYSMIATYVMLCFSGLAILYCAAIG